MATSRLILLVWVITFLKHSNCAQLWWFPSPPMHMFEWKANTRTPKINSPVAFLISFRGPTCSTLFCEMTFFFLWQSKICVKFSLAFLFSLLKWALTVRGRIPKGSQIIVFVKASWKCWLQRSIIVLLVVHWQRVRIEENFRGQRAGRLGSFSTPQTWRDVS